jgi:hypothetical protein
MAWLIGAAAGGEKLSWRYFGENEKRWRLIMSISNEKA